MTTRDKDDTTSIAGAATAATCPSPASPSLLLSAMPRGKGRASNSHRRNQHGRYFEMRRRVTVWVTEHVDEYRAVATTELARDDVVLELGCAGGVTTVLAARVCRLAVGVDKNESPQVRGARARAALERERRSSASASVADGRSSSVPTRARRS